MKILFVGLLFITGCASTNPTSTTHASNTAIFKYNFDSVWRAAQMSLQKYPIKVNNSDKGIIETEFIRDGDVWTSPLTEAKQSKRYQLKLKVLKGSAGSKPAIKVKIIKNIKKYKNFFQGPEDELGQDHLEEAIILYRIKRELIIDHALTKIQQKE